MKCYLFANYDRRPTLTEGVMSTLFSNMLESKNIAATPRIAAAFENQPCKKWLNIGVERSEFDGCFRLMGNKGGNVKDGFLVVTSTTVRTTDEHFYGVPGVEVIWQRTDDQDAQTAMLVTGMTPEEFTDYFGDKVKFMYP